MTGFIVGIILGMVIGSGLAWRILTGTLTLSKKLGK